MKNSIEKVNIENEEEYKKWCKSLKVELKENNYVTLIIDHSNEIEKRKAKEKGKFKEYLPFEIQYRLKYDRYPEKKVVLNIDVSDKQRTRAYIFMNCFIEAVQALGGFVSVDFRNNDNTTIRFPYCTFECSLSEKRGKFRDVKAEGIKTMRPSYDLVDTGKLEFKIYAVNKDGKHQNELIFDEEKNMIKNQIGDIFINLRPIYLEISKMNIEAERIREEESEIRNRQWGAKWEKEKEEEKRKKQQELRMKHQSEIEHHMEKWKHIKEIEAYVADISSYAELQPDSIKKPMKQYCDYVEKLFDKNEFFSNIIEFARNKQEHS